MTPPRALVPIPENPRAVLYCRVSKEESLTGGVTLDAQEQRLRAYALSQGLEVVALVKDDGVSGAVPFAERPAGAEVRALFLAGAKELSRRGRRHGPAHLVTAKLDRLGRDTADLLSTVREFQRAGVTVHTSDEGGEVEDLENGNAELMVTMRAAFASFERRAIKTRTKAALAFKRSQGLRTGHIPYGMRLAADGKHLESEASEAPVLERLAKRKELRAEAEKALSVARWDVACWEKLVADTSSELDLIAAQRAVDGHGPVDEFGEPMEGYEAVLVELEAKSRQRLAELREARAKLREARARCAVLVKEKKAHGSRAIAREFNADPVKYPARGAKGWSAQLVEQLLGRV